MSQVLAAKREASYSLKNDGAFIIEDYNHSKPFSNFFPGIAGVWGVPMWAFYVNRGQCIASFGIEAKDKAIMEFQPANKSYRLTSLQGFRTFIKVKTSKGVKYWEPFQDYLPGTEYDKKTRMEIRAHDLTLVEENLDLGLTVIVEYFTIPNEPFAGLVRRVSVKNVSNEDCDIDLVDGLPVIQPYGVSDWLSKHMSRTVEAWMTVRNLDKEVPYYQLNVEVADKPEVTHVKEGNFYCAFDASRSKDRILKSIVETSVIFGQATDYTAPERFLQDDFAVPATQQTSNRTPCAMTNYAYTLKSGASKQLTSVFGYTTSIQRLNKLTKKLIGDTYIDDKALENKYVIDEVKNYAFTNSSSQAFDLYAGHTFLDNILRGGLPVSLKTKEGNVSFNVYSRKHGDLERDYNYFFVSPTFYSQGNGNYRDVNQNRRNDVWFNLDVGDSHLVNFLNLSQADGYNPLVVKGTSFVISDKKALTKIINESFEAKDRKAVLDFIAKGFLPGDLLLFLDQNAIALKGNVKTFLGRVLEVCQKQELADHGEGFWTDHWHYNMDLIESYIGIYPENLESLLLKRNTFHFYHNNHYVYPRSDRYILTERGVRQYESVCDASDTIDTKKTNSLLREQNGKGKVYKTNLLVKLLCLIANKVATLDPSGIGVEMEADKPNWYDALNGLPGLIGSSLSETLEITRFAKFTLQALENIDADDKQIVQVFSELATFITKLEKVLASNTKGFEYWDQSNVLKENYRKSIRLGIKGEEKGLTVGFIKKFLQQVIKKTEKSAELGQTSKGFLGTYFYHDVTDYKKLKTDAKGRVYVRPLKFKKHVLPLYLEGYVHALRAQANPEGSKPLYEQVRKSELFDRKLKMYRVNEDLFSESEEIGRTRVFPSGWLENASIWLHMEYKFLLELIRSGLYKEFYQNFENVLVAFLDPNVYGRSILENSSFIASSYHEDSNLHGQGFVARLSGSTAEFMHIWLLMNAGPKPFFLNNDGKLNLTFEPALLGSLFTEKEEAISYLDQKQAYQNITLPKNTYAFNFLSSILVVYHNESRKDTFGSAAAKIQSIELMYKSKKDSVKISSSVLEEKYALDVRNQKIERIDIILA